MSQDPDAGAVDGSDVRVSDGSADDGEILADVGDRPDRGPPEDGGPADQAVPADGGSVDGGAVDAAQDLDLPGDEGVDDAAPVEPDASLDLGPDAVLDAELDATIDALVDAEPDAVIDATVDAEVDAEIDAEVEPPPIVATTELAADIDVIAALRDDGRFASLVFLLESAGLAEPLVGRPAITLFAPTEDAIAAFEDRNAEVLNTRWAPNPDVVSRLLRFHIVAAGDFSVDDLLSFADDGVELPTEHPDGEVVILSRVEGDPVERLRIDGAAGALISDALDGEGFVIYVLEDGMLVPDELAGDLPAGDGGEP